MTRREWDRETRRRLVVGIESASQYRRERRGGYTGGRDPLAARRPGWVRYTADLRALGSGRGNSAIRDRVAAWESSP